MRVQTSVADTSVFFFYYQQCSFQFPLHVMFLSTQKVEEVVEIRLVLGVGGVANC
jgi:hypothetical protein